MATRVVVKGRVYWQDQEARQAQKLARAHVKAVPLDRDKRPLCQCSTGRVCEIHVQRKRTPPFRAGVPWTDEYEHVTYRVLPHLDPREGWVSSEFLQARWFVTHKEILQLARHGLIDAALAENSQVRRYRARDEAAVLRSDPVLRAALKRARETQEKSHDERAEKAPPRAGRPRREHGRWVF
jgi:hypothetical protein